MKKQQLLKEKIGLELLPSVELVLAGAIPERNLHVEFVGGRFNIDFEWTPPSHCYGSHGKLNITLAKKEQETKRREIAKKVREAMVAAGLEFVKTCTRTPHSYVDVTEGGKCYHD